MIELTRQYGRYLKGHKMLKGSAYVLLLKVVGEGLGLIMVIVAGNFYSTEDVGLLFFVQNNLFLFGTIGALGLGTCFHRFLPGYLEYERYAEVRGLQRWVYSKVIVGLTIVSALLLVLVLTLNETRIDIAPTLLASIAVIIWGIITLNRNFMRAMRLTFWSEVSYQVIRPLGVTLIPEMAVPIDTGSASVSVVRLPPPRPSRTIGMVWRKANPLSAQLTHIASVVRKANCT